jgi:hypothetical protein
MGMSCRKQSTHPAEKSLKTLDKEQRDMVQVLLQGSYDEQIG